MKAVTASALAVHALGLASAATLPTTETHCAACWTILDGRGVPFKPKRSFNDVQQMAVQNGRQLCGNCGILMTDSSASNKASGSGAASQAGFQRLLSNMERVAFLTAPPKPPFAVAIITAQRQHVWWMARVAYSPNLIPLQFGHRPLIIDRPRAIAAANAVMEYENGPFPNGKTVYPFAPLSRDLKSSGDGQYTYRFEQDTGNHAVALRSDLAKLSLGDLWAMAQCRAGARELKVDTVEEAGRLAPAVLAARQAARITTQTEDDS